MNQWMIRYTRIPTNYNESRNAIIEAETAEDAATLLRHRLGDFNGVHNYVLDTPRVYDPPAVKGRVVSLDAND